MSRIWQDGFEFNSTTANPATYDTVTNGVVGTTHARSGTYAAQVTSLVTGTPRGWNKKFQTASASVTFFRAYIFIVTLPNVNNVVMAITGSSSLGSSLRCYVSLTTTGTLKLFNPSAAQIGSDSSAINDSNWHMIELKCDTTGGTNLKTIEARLDGTIFATSSVQNQGTQSDIFVGANGLSEAGTSGEWWFDDLAVNDNSGTSQTGYPGSGKILQLYPNAQGDANGFLVQVGGTLGSANNFTRVNEIPPDDATSYNASAVLNAQDLFNVQNSGIGTSDTVNTVLVGARIANITGASATTAVELQIEKTSGGTVQSSTSVVPNTTSWNTNGTSTPRNYPLVTYADPDGAAWIKTTLDSMQIGYQITATLTDAIGVTNLWASVDYTPSSGSIITKTQSSVARIANVVTKTQASVARVAVNLTKTQTSTARIAQVYTKTQSSVSRISNAITRTQTSIARVANNTSKTQSATAHIVPASLLSVTHTSIARIAVVVTKTQNSVARIANVVNKTQSSTARIAQLYSKTQTSIARVANITTKTQTSTARIQRVLNRTQTSVSRVANNITKQQTAIARVANNSTKTQSSVAHIANVITKTQTAVARIASTVTKTQTATAHIIQTEIIDSYFETPSDSHYQIVAPSGGSHAAGETFTGNGDVAIQSQFVLSATAARTGTMVSAIYAVTGTAPNLVPTGAALATSSTVSATLLTTSDQLITFSFPTPMTTVNGTHYAVVVDVTSVAGGAVKVGQNTSAPAAAGNRVDYDDLFGAGWESLSTADIYFYVIGISPFTKKFQTAIARIANNITKTQPSTARIANSFTKTQTSIARIANKFTKTQSSVARIAGTNTKTQTSTARITVNLTKTQTSTARISKALTRTQTSVSRIANKLTKTQSATARIDVISTKTQSATARIAKNLTKTQPAKARIAQTITRTQTAVARIAYTFTKTQSATARIFVSPTYVPLTDAVSGQPTSLTSNSETNIAEVSTGVTIVTVEGSSNIAQIDR